MIVVSDATPFNYLVLIDQSHLLREMYGRVLIPEAVRNEIQPGRERAVALFNVEEIKRKIREYFAARGA